MATAGNRSGRRGPRRRWWPGLLGLLAGALFAGPLLARAGAAPAGTPITSLAQLQERSGEERVAHPLDLAATVWFAAPADGRVILHDETATAEVLLDDLPADTAPGDLIRLAGRATLLNRGTGCELTRVALIDNDGIHRARERTATVWLAPGRHALRLDWFNASSESLLALDYAGPGLPRQAVPAAVLSHGQPAEPGVTFRTYLERQWMLPPQRNVGQPLRTGVVPTFDFAVAEWREYAGALFAGALAIERAGDYTFYLRSDDGSRLFLGPSSLTLERLGREALPLPVVLYPGQVLPSGTEFCRARMDGWLSRATRVGLATFFSLDSGAGHVRVEVADASALPWGTTLHQAVRLTGVVRRNRSADGLPLAGTLLVQDQNDVTVPEAAESVAAPGVRPARLTLPPVAADGPVTAVEQIERFDRATLDQRPTVRIQGVVTRVVSTVPAVVLQDRSRGIYVDLLDLPLGPVQTGNLLEVEGVVEAGEFSPFIRARRIKRLGAGLMPVPVEATREEVINGSLHSQYVEIEGYVLAVEPKAVTLRTHAGVLRIDIETETSAAWLDAVVRMRGCLRVFWDPDNLQITVGKVGLDYAEISIQRAAPADLFNVTKKRATELLKFDPYADIFQRTRLVGLVLHRDGPELCLVDEGQGVRVSLVEPAAFTPGDLVEVAGFPEFDGPSPHFAHAVARRVGHQALPAAVPLRGENLLRDAYDSTRVTVDADLIGMGFQDGRRTLQLRAGPHAFLARFHDPQANALGYEPGSRLRLTGVYLGLGGNRTLGRPVEAFELVLASTAAIEVLSTPPWWTLPRLLALVGLLCVVLLVAFLWITILRRQVAAQTRQLGIVLEERHRVEQEEALTRERSRLAYDLHDELGAGLSEIGMLGTLASSPVPVEKKGDYLSRLSETARQLIVSLDEIVWAVNPRYDPVASFVGYYTAFAQQFLELAAMRCRFDIADDLPPQSLSSRARHTLFLAFKETLHNVVKHARASEVVIRIGMAGDHLLVAVADDGCGLPAGDPRPGMDGLDSIRQRLTQLGGECVVESRPDHGTTVSLRVPLR